MKSTGKAVINEIRALLSDKETTPLPATRDRLMLAALADIYESMDGFDTWKRCVDTSLTQMQSLNKVIVFIGSALGLSILGLVFMLLTGQAQIVLP